VYIGGGVGDRTPVLK